MWKQCKMCKKVFRAEGDERICVKCEKGIDTGQKI